MTSHYHAVVWIDNREARIFHFDREGADRLEIHADHPHQHIHHKANSIGSGHAAKDEHYLGLIAAAIADSQAVLITGPAGAKTELVKHIHRHSPKFIDHIAGVETIDHPTDKQLVAYARHYFKADSELLPRV